MRYSAAAAALLMGAASANAALQAGGEVSQYYDGQVQVPTSAAQLPATTPAPEEESTSTLYSTYEVTITSCPPEKQTNCPVKVTTSVVPVPGPSSPPYVTPPTGSSPPSTSPAPVPGAPGNSPVGGSPAPACPAP
ncbi:MAG: hypothetical protein Q9167_007018, partial [Letrouitia subvulpina]